MLVTYDEISYDGYNSHVTIDEPSECPMCKHSLKPTVLHSQIIKDDNSVPFLYVTYLCTHCRASFLCKFSDMVTRTGNYRYSFTCLDLIAPKSFEEETFPECINIVSSSFIKIFNQSLAAEHYNLNEIAGIGYRKALEFLIKDFLINHEHKDDIKVKSTALGCCIDTMIDNPQLKTVASRATWLGNDQTHYEQKYTDKDIKDLKKLIKLSVNWIEMIYLTDEAEEMEKK